MEIHVLRKDEPKINKILRLLCKEFPADAIGDSSGGDVETRHDVGDQPTQDSPLKAARKLLSKVVQRIRKILRLDP